MHITITSHKTMTSTSDRNRYPVTLLHNALHAYLLYAYPVVTIYWVFFVSFSIIKFIFCWGDLTELWALLRSILFAGLFMQKMAYNPADADDFERTWLLLGNIYIEAGKYDLAEECCSRCLKYNKSSARAWELKGVILEKEASFQTASDCYKKAWELSHHVRVTVNSVWYCQTMCW